MDLIIEIQIVSNRHLKTSTDREFLTESGIALQMFGTAAENVRSAKAILVRGSYLGLETSSLKKISGCGMVVVEKLGR